MKLFSFSVMSMRPSESPNIIKIGQRRHLTVHLGIALQILQTAVTTCLKPSVKVLESCQGGPQIADDTCLRRARVTPDCPLSQRAVAPERAAAQEPPDSFQPWLALQPPACARLTLRSAACDRLLSLPARHAHRRTTAATLLRASDCY